MRLTTDTDHVSPRVSFPFRPRNAFKRSALQASAARKNAFNTSPSGVTNVFNHFYRDRYFEWDLYRQSVWDNRCSVMTATL